MSEGWRKVFKIVKSYNGGTAVKRESSINVEAMTVREFGNVAAERGVSAASLLVESGPQPSPLVPSD